jgi:hypothetical protein
MVAEEMKKKLEEELVQTKLSHSYEVEELRGAVNTLEAEVM